MKGIPLAGLRLKALSLSLLVMPTSAWCADLEKQPEPAPEMIRSVNQTLATTDRVSFSEYLAAVERYSLDLETQRGNIAIAEGQLSVAGLPPDPVLSLGRSEERHAIRKPSSPPSNGASLSFTLETAGKRGARKALAEHGVKLAQANLGAFLRSLYNDAGNAYLNLAKAQMTLKRKEITYQALLNLVHANERRLSVGDIGGLELYQSRVEMQRYRNELSSARADLASARIGLSVPLGRPAGELFTMQPTASDIELPLRQFDLDSLLAQAVTSRDDIRVAREARSVAQSALDLAHANRWVDPQLSVGETYSPVAPDGSAYSSRVLSMGVSVPIPFSRLQRGELRQAEAALTQADLQLRATEVRARADVQSSFTQFQAASDQLRDYRDHILADADFVLNGMRISYRKGAASLLELLNAQRTADDVYAGYIDAQYAYGQALISLQTSVGLRPRLDQ